LLDFPTFQEDRVGSQEPVLSSVFISFGVALPSFYINSSTFNFDRLFVHQFATLLIVKPAAAGFTLRCVALCCVVLHGGARRGEARRGGRCSMMVSKCV